MFTGLTRQQGASKHHISQIQISYESRTVKNSTFSSLTPKLLESCWADARKAQKAIADHGFWSCDLQVAADRKLHQKLNEKDECAPDDVDDADDAASYVVERVMRVASKAEVQRTPGLEQAWGTTTFYIVKWEGWAAADNTVEPELCVKGRQLKWW